MAILNASARRAQSGLRVCESGTRDAHVWIVLLRRALSVYRAVLRPASAPHACVLQHRIFRRRSSWISVPWCSFVIGVISCQPPADKGRSVVLSVTISGAGP
ncbi:unnamed protein product, partial [Iphiclides podalirius]